MEQVDVLTIAAHPDDIELTCAGTLIRMVAQGYSVGILDLTEGEMGTRGRAEDRAREAAEAARILRVCWREALDIPDSLRAKVEWALAELAKPGSPRNTRSP